MNTDTPFYRLFQERPATVFELAGLPVPANPASRFNAEEVKQTAFRLDGLLQPETGRDDLPLVFVETGSRASARLRRWCCPRPRLPCIEPRPKNPIGGCPQGDPPSQRRN